MILRPPAERQRLTLARPIEPVFIGLGRAAAEGWSVMRWPASRRVMLAATHGWRKQVEEFRRRYCAAWMSLRRQGAVVVAFQDGAREAGRVWWFGLPPAGWRGDLEALAAAAGMLGDPPRTFAWFGRHDEGNGR